MKIETKFFDVIEFDSETIINFIDPILGFEEYKKFILIDIEDNDSLKCLQSTEEKNICFILADPWKFFENYDFDFSDDSQEKLGVKETDELIVYNIANIPGNLSEFSLNLMAPIIINTNNKQAIQFVITDDKYHTKHFVVS
jgi:flagellar assembly factor FliW